MLSLDQQANSKQQGDVGLGVAIGWFTMNGYRVSIPLTDSQDYDLVVERAYKLFTVQVRTTYHEKYPGIYQLDLRVNGGNRSGSGKVKHLNPDHVDYLFAITNSGDKFLIPSRELEARRSINLGEKYLRYKVT